MLVTSLGKVRGGPSRNFCVLLWFSLADANIIWGSESCVVGSIEALGFVPVIQRPRFYLARPLPAVSCLPLGKSFALNGFRVLGSEKRPFPFTTFQERVLIHMNLFTWQGWSHFAHSLANCHPVMSFQAIKMWLKARMWVQTPTEVATRQMYVRLFFAG